MSEELVGNQIGRKRLKTFFCYLHNSALISTAADGAARIFLLLSRGVIREKVVSLGVRTHVSTVGSRDAPDWDR